MYIEKFEKIAKSEALIDYARAMKEKLSKDFSVDVSRIVWIGLNRFIVIKNDGSSCVVVDYYI